MNALRRLLLPVLLALLAFAIGIALGGGPLQTDEGGDNSAALARDNNALQNEVASIREGSRFDEGISQALAPGLLAGRLKDRGITMLVLPGVDDETATATRQALVQAGAQVPILARLDEDLLDPAKKTYVDSVATSSLDGAPDLAELTDAGTYERVGALIARAYTGQGASANVDDEASKIDSELQGAKLVSLAEEPIRRGTFVAVLAPGDHGAGSLTTAQMVITHELITAVVAGSDAVVVGTTPTASLPGGLIDVLADDEELASQRLSTVNVIDSVAGRTALVFALDAAASGAPGHFGIDGGEAVLPPGLGPKGD